MAGGVGGGGAGGGGGGAGGGTGIAYHRQFQHDDWFDGSDRVSAGGPRGFNGKFHSLEAEFDAISATIADIAHAIDLLEVQAQGKNILIGNVGINNPNPQMALDVTGYIRQNRLTLSGDAKWSSLTYNAYHDASNTTWVFPDPTLASVTLEIDEDLNVSKGGRFQVYTAAPNSKSWTQRFAINGATGDVTLGLVGGKLGVGSGAPNRPLAVRAQGGSEELIAFENPAGATKWHINQNLGGNNAGLNFVETDVLDGRLFIKAGGGVGIGNIDPAYAIDINGRSRLRQNLGRTGGDSSAGFWYMQNSGGDRAFMGMYDDINFGLYSNFPDFGVTRWIQRTNLMTGATISIGPFLTGPFDLAENWTSDTVLEPCDVVCADPNGDHRIIRSARANDLTVLGVISTHPGFLLGAPIDRDASGLYPVTLSGRTPCKVTAENGPIRPGDLLSSSSTPGHAMRAPLIEVGMGHTVARQGTIVGKALGSLESETGVIDIFAVLA